MFCIYREGQLIGHSELEQGDPPMGVVHGIFNPTLLFDNIRPLAEELPDEDMRRWQGLELRKHNGEIVECTMGVVVIEYGSQNGPFEIEVTCLGIGYPLYGELFPHHVRAYNESFA